MTTTATTNKYQEAFQKLKHTENSMEAKAFARFEKMGFPTRKSEVYKYSNMNYFKNLTPNTDATTPHKIPEYFKHDYLQDKHILVTINGIFSESLSQIQEDDSGLVITCMCDARKEYRDVVVKHFNETANDYPDVFSELNTAFSHCGIFIYAKKNTVGARPIVILNLGSQQKESSLASQRNLIVVEENAQIEIIEDYSNLEENRAFNLNHFSEYFIEENASLKIGIYQEELNDFYFVGNKFFEQARNSRLKITAMDFGGNFIRNNFRVNLNGENAEAMLNGVFINDDKAHTDVRILINHNAPHCQSFQTFKGIIDDEATGVFNGKVYVAEGAQKTNAFQSNKNILLSEDATMNTKPELEIYADDVKCSHGATCGQLDDDAIFYAETRGIPENKARKLIVFAFAQDVVQQIENEPFKHFVERRLIHKLDLSEYSTFENVQSGLKE